jgi:hypothetical protein
MASMRPFLWLVPVVLANVIDVRDFGGVGDGITLNTQARLLSTYY